MKVNFIPVVGNHFVSVLFTGEFDDNLYVLNADSFVFSVGFFQIQTKRISVSTHHYQNTLKVTQHAQTAVQF